MAPEQLAGREVSAKSDIYSLGLVLYEVFTGRRAIDGSTPTEIARQQGEATPTSPSSLVEGLNQAVERTILRCLESDPSQRPGSALAVASSLPGGDPLAAALSAGETPPPELVAEAGKAGGLKPWVAWSCLLTSVVGVLLAIQLAGMHQLGRLVPPGKAPQVLAEKARELMFELGYEVPPHDSTYGYEANQPYLDRLAGSDRWQGLRERLAVGQPPGLWFWHRESPRYLTRLQPANFVAIPYDPPATVPGMLETRFDPQGRLRALEVVSPSRDDAVAAAAEPEWGVLFDAAGFEIDAFTAVESRWTPRVFADRRAAWEGTYPDDPDTAIRVEAAAYLGRPVSFRIFEPWTPVDGKRVPVDSLAQRLLRRSYNALVLVILFGSSLIAWRNLRSGRGDRKGAWRLAFYLLCVRMLVWLFGADDRLEPSALDTFLSHLAWALYRFGIVWLFYIALEPYLRRIWPDTMVSWVRLLRGRFKDPLVGRDVLIGVAATTVLMVTIPTVGLGVTWLGAAPLLPATEETTLEALRGTPHAVAAMLYEHDASLLWMGMYLVVLLSLSRLVLRRTWLAIGAYVVTLAVLQAATTDVGGTVDWSIWAVKVAAWLLVFFRAGLLSLLVSLGINGLWHPLTRSLDPASWFSSGTYIALLLTLGAAAYGFYVSLAGRPLLGDAFLDSPRGEGT